MLSLKDTVYAVIAKESTVTGNDNWYLFAAKPSRFSPATTGDI